MIVTGGSGGVVSFWSIVNNERVFFNLLISYNIECSIYVTVYRKTRHNAAPFE